MKNTTILASAIETPYVDEKHRFVVSLVLGVPDDDSDPTAQDALGAALATLHLGDRGADQTWCVYDRSTNRRVLIDAGDLFEATARQTGAPTGAVGLPSDPHAPQRALDWVARDEAVKFLDSLPWGDVDNSLASVKETLRLALEATASDLERWENKALDRGYSSEYALTPEEVRALTPRWRLAYVARLIESIGVVYGTEQYNDRSSPSTILTTLADIVLRAAVRRS